MTKKGSSEILGDEMEENKQEILGQWLKKVVEILKRW